jgi:alpha-tubulin suppressor-like RCC1 family protein
VSTSGAVYCWDSRLLPVPVSGGLSFATVSVGGRHTCGVTTDGFAYCWGSNGYGELGEGDTTFQPSPVAVAGGLRFASVSAGMIHSCGLTTSGTVYCWGFNADGQLGDSTTDDRLSPVPVAGGHTFTSVSAGSYHTCAVTTGGDAYCWGDDELGQLGDGTNGTQREAPVLVLGALTFASVTAGYAQTCGLTTDHVAYCWGSGGSGQLGSSPSGRSLVPTRVVQ